MILRFCDKPRMAPPPALHGQQSRLKAGQGVANPAAGPCRWGAPTNRPQSPAAPRRPGLVCPDSRLSQVPQNAALSPPPRQRAPQTAARPGSAMTAANALLPLCRGVRTRGRGGQAAASGSRPRERLTVPAGRGRRGRGRSEGSGAGAARRGGTEVRRGGGGRLSRGGGRLREGERGGRRRGSSPPQPAFCAGLRRGGRGKPAAGRAQRRRGKPGERLRGRGGPSGPGAGGGSCQPRGSARPRPACLGHKGRMGERPGFEPGPCLCRARFWRRRGPLKPAVLLRGLQLRGGGAVSRSL